MPIDLSAIYSNPLIPPGYYMARVDDVQTEDQGAAKPRIRVDLTLDGNDSEVDGTSLVAILHPSERGMAHYDTFESAFGITNGQYKDAVGKWGVVYVRENLFKGTAHGSVKFMKQTTVAKEKAAKLEAEAPTTNDFE